jgi:hypothetical protein
MRKPRIPFDIFGWIKTIHQVDQDTQVRVFSNTVDGSRRSIGWIENCTRAFLLLLPMDPELALSPYYCRWIQTIHPTATEVATTSRWALVENSVRRRIGTIAV